MRNITVLEAYKEALKQEMELDPSVLVIGEDVRIGGPYAIYKGMVDIYGEDRVINTPISEIAYTGMAIGAAMKGKRPVIDFQFGDFVFSAMDQLANQAAKMHYMSDGQLQVPLTVCLPVGANRRGAQHSQCTESVFMNIPGMKIVVPSSSYDAKGLTIAAIRDNNPVLVYQHKLLYGMGKGNSMRKELCYDVPEEAYAMPLGSARVCREGKHATVVATQLMLIRTLEAADRLAEKGIEVEVIDPRSIMPFDTQTVAASAKKTGVLVAVEECPTFGGWGNEAIASVSERVSGLSVIRIGEKNTPIPYATVLENEVIPTVDRIEEEIEKLLRRS